jgi:hypothetical protein
VFGFVCIPDNTVRVTNWPTVHCWGRRSGRTGGYIGDFFICSVPAQLPAGTRFASAIYLGDGFNPGILAFVAAARRDIWLTAALGQFPAGNPFRMLAPAQERCPMDFVGIGGTIVRQRQPGSLSASAISLSRTLFRPNR